MRALATALCLLATTACAGTNPTSPSVSLNERFTLAPSETARVVTTDIRLQFVQVTGDSRCPADAVCIQGGDAIVEVRVLDAGTAMYALHTGDASRAAVRHGSLRIELAELQPYPFSSRTVQPGEYRATFIVTRP